MLTIRLYEESDRKAWDSFVLNHPDGTVFHLSSWKDVIERTFRHQAHYLIAVADQGSAESGATHPAIVGILPLFTIKSVLFGRQVISVPFAELGGPLASGKEVIDALMHSAIEYSQTHAMDYLELRSKYSHGHGLPEKDLYVNFSREILPSLDENMEAIPRKARRMIRQGEKVNLLFEFGVHNLHSFYEILARNYHQLGTPIFTKRLFESFSSSFGEMCNVLHISTSDGKPIAGVLFFLFKDRIIPYYAGSDVAYRNLAPNDFMYWQLMKFGWEKGFRIFDFGRSKVNTGSYDFKRHWGFEPQPLHYQYYLNRLTAVPNISPANPKYKTMIACWQRLPFGITKVVGPPIARYLG